MKHQINQRTRPKRVVNSRRPVDPIITAQRFMVPAAHIPQYNVAPSVTRIVRIVYTLASGAPSYLFKPLDVAQADALGYTGSFTPRYITMRFLSARFWAESPANLSVSQQAYGLVVYEPSTAFTISDRPTTGSRLSAIGLRFPFSVRTTFYLCSDDTTNIVRINSDTIIAASTDYTVTCDFTVEFTG
jgi:hypothetical protein